MSTIVIVKKNGETAMAADTLTTEGGTKIAAGLKVRKEKILKFQDTYIGFVGYCVHQNVFESVMDKHPGDLSFRGHRHIFETLLKLHPILKEKFFVNPKEYESDPYESSQMDMVVANPHGIFAVSSYRDVTEFETFWAIGSGRDYALGAMYHAYRTPATAHEVAVAGVIAATEFDNCSGLPYSVYGSRLVNRAAPAPVEAVMV